MAVRVVSYAVPAWGVGELWYERGTLVNHELPRAGRPPRGVGSSPLVDRIRAYFAGHPVAYEGVAIDLSWTTPFQQSVADVLRDVPYGETVTYGELAVLAGHPNAHRAAGTFCAGNRFPLILPCHRVVSATGVGSYGSLGAPYKRRLLALEGVER
ncbi:MAG: methylated-DNA--[protein]-cysteine S-methyltransferase [Actinobacteria bacterium]|nr:methylated-DNA--[protein]-cysteine S-methyltransferase [Actinomycetota bacterium]